MGSRTRQEQGTQNQNQNQDQDGERAPGDRSEVRVMTLIIFTQQTQQDGEFKVSQKDQKGNSHNLVQTGVDICFNTAEGYLNIGQICPEKKKSTF